MKQRCKGEQEGTEEEKIRERRREGGTGKNYNKGDVEKGEKIKGCQHEEIIKIDRQGREKIKEIR